MTTNRLDVAIIATERDSRMTCGTAYGHVKIRFGFIDESDELQYHHYRGYGDEFRNELADLEVRNQVSSGDPSSSACGSYGWSCEYRDLFSLNRERAELIAKTLRRVERLLESERAVLGNPLSFGQYVARVMKALKIQRAFLMRNPRGDCRSRLIKPGDAICTIDRLTSELRDDVNALAA